MRKISDKWSACGEQTKLNILTQNSEKGLGGLDRHGEEWACVLALVWQADVTNADGKLLPRGSYQLDPVVPQSCMRHETQESQSDTESSWIHWWQLAWRRTICNSDDV